MKELNRITMRRLTPPILCGAGDREPSRNLASIAACRLCAAPDFPYLILPRADTMKTIDVLCRARMAPRAAPWRQRGSSIVELAIVAPIVLLMLLGLIELSMAFFADLSMQYAVREAARYAVTGQVNDDPNSANQQQYMAVLQKLQDSSAGLYAKVSPVLVVNNTTYSTAASYTANMFGNPGDIVVLQVLCSWKLATPVLNMVFPGGVYKFTVGATMQNEQYGSDRKSTRLNSS